MVRTSVFPRDPARTLVLAALLALFAPAATHAQFVNDPAGEPAGANQSSPSLAELDGILVAAFTDYRAGSSNRIRCSYSTDSGATWIPLGVPPAIGAAHWVTDPRVVASPVHGKFFVFGSAIDYPAVGAFMACVPLSFPGGVPQWGTPRDVRVTWPGSSMTIQFGHDAAASPTTGRLFAASLFHEETGLTHLDLQYSDDEGQTWSQPFRQDSVGTWPVLRVHGNRVYLMNAAGTPAWLAVTAASGPSWWTLGRVPKAREAMSPGYGPGGRLNTFAIDASGGPHDGRVYAVWTESYDFGDDPMSDPVLEANPVAEVEPNETYATATPFQVGDVLRGAIETSNADFDHFRVHLDAGQRVILWADSADAGIVHLDLVVRDAAGARPAYQRSYAQREGRFTFVAARADDYDFALGAYFTGGGPRGYRLRTAPGFAGAEPATDQCDLVSAWSDDDGATWSAPVRAGGSPAGLFDDGPIVEVTADGRPQVGYWARTATAGVLDARWRLLRSNDAGASWQAGARLTTTSSSLDWTMLTSAAWGINAMLPLADRIVHAFAELQPAATVHTDIRATLQPKALEVVSCGANYAGGPGDVVHPAILVKNADPFFSEPIRLAASFDRNWPAVEDTVDARAATNTLVTFDLAIPDTAAAGEVRMQLVVAHLGEVLASCLPSIYVQAGAGVEEGGPVAFGLHRVWPNPAGGAANVRFGLPRPAWVTLDVLDVHGRRVARLADRLHEAGGHDLAWDGRGPGGARLPAGVYLLDLRSGGRRDVRRLVLLD